jgi:outer membrane receptor protein involved in Fe transport
MRRVEAVGVAALANRSVLRLGGRWFRTDGFYQFEPTDRGPIDRRLESRHTLVHSDLTTGFGEGWQFNLGARAFEEDRGNGTPFQRNESRERAAHLRLGGSPRPGLEIGLAAYVQSQSFASGFSAVDDARAGETPALDQFDVPATAAGLSAVGNWAHVEGARTTVGGDFRQVRGETREAYLFSGDTFQRQRFAGGSQRAAGVFVVHSRKLTESLRAQAAFRLDHWRDFDGHRRELLAASGETTRDDRFADRSGWESSPALGMVWQASSKARVRANVYRAFRTPTLNELYRPFRVGDVATDANPGLSTETLNGAELGAEWASDGWSFAIGVFENQLEDAVANVTLSTGGSLVQRRRENLDRVRVRGLELQAAWSPSSALRVSLDILLSDPEVKKATIAPALEGRTLPQAPREVVTARIHWRLSDSWQLVAAARLAGSQFEDDENQLVLPSATVLDLMLVYRVNDVCDLHFAVDNAGDESVAVALDADGRFSYGAPRLARAGLEWRF